MIKKFTDGSVAVIFDKFNRLTLTGSTMLRRTDSRRVVEMKFTEQNCETEVFLILEKRKDIDLIIDGLQAAKEQLPEVDEPEETLPELLDGLHNAVTELAAITGVKLSSSFENLITSLKEKYKEE